MASVRKGYGGNDKLWQDLLKKVRGVGDSHVKVGVLGAKGEARAQGSDEGLTVAQLAAIHEYGAPSRNIPQRSFIRRPFEENPGDLAAMTAKVARQFMRGEMSLVKALNVLGLWGSQQIKNRVLQQVIPPPNRPSTVKAKGSSRPLVDTGQMINAVTWEVKE